MNKLNLGRANLLSPYSIRLEREKYVFVTDYDIVYSVEFEPYVGFGQDETYWFILSNQSHKPSPNDPKLRATVICIIEEFFRVNEKVLLYICDTANGLQAMRSRLFLRWFNGYAQKQKYDVRTAMIEDEGVENYVSLIIRLSHPNYVEIIQYFEETINLFKSNKP